jgi:hypothetical protein
MTKYSVELKLKAVLAYLKGSKKLKVCLEKETVKIMQLSKTF